MAALIAKASNLERVAEKYGTPLYVYSAGTILDHYRRLDAALSEIDHLICYAVKANSNRAILKLLAREGAGFDIVSGGELFRVLRGRRRSAKMHLRRGRQIAGGNRVCARPGRPEFQRRERSGTRCTSIGSRGAKGVQAPIALRVNPDVDAGTHRYISTGRSENKFGIALDRVAEVYEQAARMPNIAIRGVQMHIGSQITDAAPFAEAIAKVTPLILKLKEQFALEFFSIGGGIGIVYESSFASGSRRLVERQGSGPGDDDPPAHDPRLRRRHPAAVARQSDCACCSSRAVCSSAMPVSC